MAWSNPCIRSKLFRARRNSCLDQQFSIGKTSRGRQIRLPHPQTSASRMPATLWVRRLSITSHTPQPEVRSQYLFHIYLKSQPIDGTRKSHSPTNPQCHLNQSQIRCHVDKEHRYKLGYCLSGNGIASCHCQV